MKAVKIFLEFWIFAFRYQRIWLKIVSFDTRSLLWDISLDFWAQKVYRFVVAGKSVLKETTGAIWMEEEGSHLLNYWW